MKKLLLGAAALLALGATANAADLPARTYTKAPAPIIVQNWTGFFLGGGGGFGSGTTDSFSTTLLGATPSPTLRFGQRGWFGTVSGGYDYQFSPSWVAGIFGDAQFSDIKGTISDQITPLFGNEKLRESYAAGARLGYLIAPNVLSYANVGYTHANFSGSTFSTAAGVPTNTTSKFGRDGWFIGTGVENNLDFFGIRAPGWTVKTEYRYAYYGNNSVTESTLAGVPANLLNFKSEVQTISTQLVYKFNWR